MAQPDLPGKVTRLAADEKFNFACRPGLECFTECCRELELALSPYDVLCLKNKLGLRARDFLDRYVLIEKEAEGLFPRLYLGMVDDGRASCPFVTANGCAVYDSRPGACRVYPLGRAASQSQCGHKKEFHVLITEGHCRGFAEPAAHSAATWTEDQGLSPYNELNDQVMTILQHSRIRQGMRLNNEQRDRYLLALYNLDDFRDSVLKAAPARQYSLTAEAREDIALNDVALLRFAVRYLLGELFGEGG